MELNLKKSGLLVWLLYFTYGNNFILPNNLCKLFNKLLFAIICFPLLMFSIWIPYRHIDDGQDRFFATISSLILLISLFFLGYQFYINPTEVIQRFLSILVITSILVFLIFLITKSKKIYNNQMGKILNGKIKSYKENYCLKINWIK